MRKKEPFHKKFLRSGYFQGSLIDKQYPIKMASTDHDAYLIPNIEYPFDQCRVVVANTEGRWYLSPRKESFRTSLMCEFDPIAALKWSENPLDALMFTTSSGYRQLSSIKALNLIRDIAKCSIDFMPSDTNWYDIGLQVCCQAEPLIDTNDEAYFIVAIVTMGNTFMIHKQKKFKRSLSWDETIKGYSFNISSCLHRATWKWSTEELKQIAARTKMEPYDGIMKEAKQCLYNHPLVKKKKYVTHIAKPEIYLLDPITFRILKVERMTNIEIVHSASRYQPRQYEYGPGRY